VVIYSLTQIFFSSHLVKNQERSIAYFVFRIKYSQSEYFARIIFVIRALLLLPLTTAEPTTNCNCTCVSHRTHAMAGPWSWFYSRETLVSTPRLIMMSFRRDLDPNK